MKRHINTACLQMAVKMEGASPPVFEQIFRNARFAQGGNALFEGKVAGSPRPQVGKLRNNLWGENSVKNLYCLDRQWEMFQD